MALAMRDGAPSKILDTYPSVANAHPEQQETTTKTAIIFLIFFIDHGLYYNRHEMSRT